MKFRKILLAILWFVLAIWSNIYWFLLLFAIAIVSTLLQRTSFYNSIKQKFLYKVYLSIKALCLIFVLALVVRCFFIEIFSIPSGSMEKTLLPGDKIIVEKLTLGPDRPCSLLEVPNLGALLSLWDDAKAFSNENKIPSKRLAGFRDVKHNDVLVFKAPNNKTFFIKRFVGLPGDTFCIDDARVLINDSELISNENTVYNWELFSKNTRKINHLLDSLSIFPSSVRQENGHSKYVAGLTKADAGKVQLSGVLDSVKLHVQKPEKGRGSIYPKNKEIETSIDYWGPVVVPRKGMTLLLNQKNFLWYKKVIKKYEGHILEEKGEDKFLLDGMFCSTYTFQQDYFLALGDNRPNSRDSRYWGFVPEKNIVGKARLIIASNDPSVDGWGSFRMDRFFKYIE